MTVFGFGERMRESERAIVDGLGLARIPLDAACSEAHGTFRERPVTLEARAYAGGVVRYARFIEIAGDQLEIANILVLPASRSVPLFGFDLVSLSPQRAVVVLDLTPIETNERPIAQPLHALPQAATPSWCRDLLSERAVFARIGREHVGDLPELVRGYVRAFLSSCEGALDGPDDVAVAAQREYCAAHASRGSERDVLSRMFTPAFAARFVDEVMFPRAEG